MASTSRIGLRKSVIWLLRLELFLLVAEDRRIVGATGNPMQILAAGLLEASRWYEYFEDAFMVLVCY
jgi:hypothetical protein